MTTTDTRADDKARLRDEAQTWLIRLTSGQATRGDAEAFRQWHAQSAEHASAFHQTRELWQAIGPANTQLEQAPNNVQRMPVRSISRRTFLGGAIAASLAAVLVYPTLPSGFGRASGDFSTAVGEQRHIDLASGLSVELNTDTRINRQGVAGDVPSIEVLAGEIEVVAQTAIQVTAGIGVLSTSGGRFNVRTNGDSICVTCLEGSLKLTALGSSVMLPSGRQLIYDQRQLGEPSSFDPEQVMAWRQQLLVFNDAPLSVVLDEINRYRPGMILLVNKELGLRKVQARFRLNQLTEVADLIRNAYGATVTELPGGVMLVS